MKQDPPIAVEAAGRPFSAQLEDGPPTFKQCTKCHFTRPIKMFYRHKMYRDGFDSTCKVCRNEALRTKRWRRWLAKVATFVCLLASPVAAQEPEYLGETYVQAAWLVMEPNASQAQIFFDKGHGSYPIPLAATINWKLTVGGNQYKYALFRIRDGGVLTDDYWATETAAWTAYQTHKNVETLKATSGRFANFNLTSDYTVPRLVMPVVWKDQTKHSSAETADSTLLVLRKQDGTYQWTVRGPNGNDNFTPATTLEEAKDAAEDSL